MPREVTSQDFIHPEDMRWQRKGSAEIAYLRDAISNHSSFLFLAPWRMFETIGLPMLVFAVVNFVKAQVLLAAQFGLQPLLTKQLLPRGHVPQVFLLSSNFSKILISLLILLLPGFSTEALQSLQCVAMFCRFRVEYTAVM